MFLTPWVKRLLIANVAMFFVAAPGSPLYYGLALIPLATHLRPWSPLTYMFLHGGIGHLFFNMIGLFFFGPRLEERLGSKVFLALYLSSGLGGAAFSFVFAPQAAVVGASAAVFGVLLGFAMYWPHENIYIWGVLPVPARILALFLVFTSLFAGFSGAQDGTAHFAHLGGLAVAFGFLKWRDRKKKPRKIEQPNSHYKAPGVKDIDARSRWESIPLEELHSVNRDEVQVLLDKIQKTGVRSLSGDERTFLERMANSVLK